jgi:hypothetical protein
MVQEMGLTIDGEGQNTSKGMQRRRQLRQCSRHPRDPYEVY